MELKRREVCPLCSSRNIDVFKGGTIDPRHIDSQDFRITDSRYGSLWNFSLCKDCTFVFSNPYIPADQIVEFYSRLEDREYSLEAGGRARNFKTILKRLKEIEKPGNALLDIGAASGIFLDLARGQGYDINGIEPCEFLVNEAKRLYEIELWPGTIEDFQVERKFSVIALLDLIEHLVEPDKFMTRVDSLLERGGIIVIVTPDIASLAARIAGKHWWHFRVAHINFFNLRAITFLLEKHRYEIVKKKRYAWNFSLLYLVTRIFPSLKDKKTLQKTLKSIHLKLQLFDSLEIYARKK